MLARAVLWSSAMRWILTVLIVIGVVATAHARPRRVAVLELEGPEARKIRTELVKQIQPTHTVIPLESWKRTAKSLGATKVTAANVKKVAKKLRVDAVIDGAIDGRRGGYRVRMSLRSGTTGKQVEEVEVMTNGTSFDKAARRDIRAELVDVITSLDDDPPSRKRASR